ncbi:MAG TPA: hypothetical protein PLH94_01595 [Fimbriimonadaceae bacterium]|nr:hypothetical protein [Fimbriimonadaceae bacterium]
MNKKLAIRFAVGIGLIAVLVVAFQWFRSLQGDFDFGKADTADWVVAVQRLDEGSQVIVIKPDGAIVAAPDHRAGSSDQEPVWRPDGNRVFFSSNRAGGAYEIFRWNPQSGKVEKRSSGSRSKGSLWCGPKGDPQANVDFLITAGGFVVQYDPKTGSGRQVLPPTTEERAMDEEGGSSGQFDSMYRDLGKSFQEAQWGPGRRWIVAKMVRENGDEILVYQGVEPEMTDKGLQIAPPAPIAAGNKIDFDVAPSGEVVVSIQGFRWPTEVPAEFIKDGKATTPYLNGLIVINPETPGGPKTLNLFITKERQVLASPRLSPDGKSVAVVAGTVDEQEQFVPASLVVLPVEERGIDRARPLSQGTIYEPSWHPSGTKLVFAKRDSEGKRSLYAIPSDGGTEQNLTGGKGDFANPSFSPQTK